MDPATVAAMSMTSTVMGTGLKIGSDLWKGQAESKAMKYKAGVAEMNKATALKNRDWSYIAGETDAIRSGRKTSQMIGSQKVRQAAGNLDVNKGSAVQVRDSQHAVGKEEQSNIRTNASRRAFGYETQAANKQAEASMYRAGAKNAKTASYINAASSLIGGASSVSSKWLQGQQLGIWGDSGRTIDVGSAHGYDGEWEYYYG